MTRKDQIGVAWRVGRKVGRTIYAQFGAEPSDDDELIGVMDTPELAEAVVRAHEALMPHPAKGPITKDIAPTSGQEGMTMYRFEIYRDWRGEFRWRLVSDGGHVFANSGDGYPSEEAADLAVQGIRPKMVDARIEVMSSAA